MTSSCPNGHAQTWKCHEVQPLTCYQCKIDAESAEEEVMKGFKAQAHNKKMAKIKGKLGAQTKIQKDLQPAKKKDAALQQQESSVSRSDSQKRTPDSSYRAGSPNTWSNFEEEEPVERDPGVTDAVREQLQVDKAAAIEEQKQHGEAIKRARGGWGSWGSRGSAPSG